VRLALYERRDAAEGISSKGAAEDFLEHAKDERHHGEWAAQRIDELGGNPNFNPEGLTLRSATEYGSAEKLIDMIEEDLVAERIVIERYLPRRVVTPCISAQIVRNERV